MACLDTVIGLSRTPCNCFEDTPSGFDTSDSGYYLDELEGLTLNMTQAASDCEQGNVWDILSKARTNAIKDFTGDLLSQLGSYNKKRLENLTYNIGSQKYNESFNPGTTYAGVRLVPRQIRNGVIKLNSVKLIFNTTGVIQCRLFNNISSTPIQSFTINCVANTASQSAALNYELPMYESGEQLQYFLVYELPVSGLPLKNKIVCSSCLNWGDCCTHFGNRIVKDQTWNNNLWIGGIYGDTWTGLEHSNTTANQNYGFILNITMFCDFEQLICDNVVFDGSNGLPMAIAKSVQLKAGALLIDYILSSGNIDRYIMLDRERMLAKKSEFLGEYSNRILWLSQNIDSGSSGCYVCEPNSKYVGIKS